MRFIARHQRIRPKEVHRIYEKHGGTPYSTAVSRMMQSLEQRGLVVRLIKRREGRLIHGRYYGNRVEKDHNETLAWFAIRGKHPVISKSEQLLEITPREKLIWRLRGKDYGRSSKLFVAPPHRIWIPPWLR